MRVAGTDGWKHERNSMALPNRTHFGNEVTNSDAARKAKLAYLNATANVVVAGAFGDFCYRKVTSHSKKGDRPSPSQFLHTPSPLSYHCVHEADLFWR